MPTTPQWLFGPFRLDTTTLRLWDGETPVPLPPKAFDVLHYLVTHPERLVTKDELLDAVWPATTVTDAVVRVAIGAARKALGETARTPRYIATVSRRGYCFRATVARVEPGELPSPETRLRSGSATPSSMEVATLPQAVSSSPAPHDSPQAAHVEPPAFPGGARQQVTVLVGEIPATLALLRDYDTEVVQQCVEPALQAMMDAVHRYGGMVHQVRGAGILALFGAPLAQEDHALRACYAALAMRTALRRYADDMGCTHGWTLQSRIGLHAGEVVLRARGQDGPPVLSLLGPTAALAEHLQQWASPDTIVLSATTAQLVAGVTHVTAAGCVALAGLAEPVEVYTLHGARSRPGRLHTARVRGLTPFVGRQEELAALHRVLPQAAVGHGQLVAVVGEAGVGKSRLVDEWLQAASAQGWRVLDSAAVSYGQAMPYFPVLDLLRQYWHLEEGEDAATITARVTAQVEQLDGALQETLPALLAVLEALSADSPFLRLDPPQRRQHTFAALKHLLVRASQVQPLLLVIEDVHWLDSETQALLESLSTSLPTARLLLLLTYRPDYQHGWGSKTYYTHVRLDPLPPASADALLQVLLGSDPGVDALKALLIQRTAGNPFFLEESVRTLVEMGTLVGERGAYRVAHAVPPLPMPATVQAVLAARIDRLPSEARVLLQMAAVIGPEAPWPLLKAIATMPDEGLYQGLAHLQTAEFLYETSVFPEPAYTFKHALTREVAYGGLLQAQRRILHARIVAALEALAGDRVIEQVERLAHHALRGEVWDKALTYGRQAGEKGMARSAHREAVEYFELALTALPHLPETHATREQAVDLRLALRSALFPSGDFERILGVLRETEALAEALDDPRRLGQVSVLLSTHFRRLGAYGQAITAARRALALATAGGDVILRALANLYIGLGYAAQGDYRQAIDCLQQTVASLDGARCHERFGQLFLPAVTSRVCLAVCHAELGMFAEGRALGAEGIRIAETVAHPGSLMWAYLEIGLLSVRQGDLRRATSLLEQAMGICHEVDLSGWRSPIAAALGAAYILGGRVADGMSLLTQALEGSATTSVSYQTLCRLSLGEAQARAGRLEEAYVCAEGVLAYARTHQARGYQAYALRLLGDIAARREPPEILLADGLYRQALTLADDLGMRPLQAHCHWGLGLLYAATGQREQARVELLSARTMSQAMAMAFWLPEIEAVLAQVAEH